MKRILVLTPHYLPGQDGGGPIRSIANIVEQLGDDLAFTIVTRDHDLRSFKSYASITAGEWTAVGKAKVLYVSDRRFTVLGVRSILNGSQHDVLYINGLFSPMFSVVPMVLRKLRLISLRPVIVAVRGECSPGALALKRFKKRLFLFLAKIAGLYRQPLMTWQASSADEEADIRRCFQDASVTTRITVARNLVRHTPTPAVVTDRDVVSCQRSSAPHERKGPGRIEAVFVSRISPKKNLLGLLNALGRVRGGVRLDVYGPVENSAYWASCLEVVERLPANIDVQYRGILQNSLVGETLSKYQLFAFPTSGENFGHVISEALMAGCPVLTTDATPWAEIESVGAGSIVRGIETADVAAALQRHIDMDDTAQRRMSSAARELGERRAADPETIASNRALFVNAACEAAVIDAVPRRRAG